MVYLDLRLLMEFSSVTVGETTEKKKIKTAIAGEAEETSCSQAVHFPHKNITKRFHLI